MSVIHVEFQKMHVIPSRFKDEDVLYLFEAMIEMLAAVDAYSEGDSTIDDLTATASEIDAKFEEISNRVCCASFLRRDY